MSQINSNNNVEIREVNPSKGRGLFAKRNIKLGETILEEDPLVCCQFSWNKEYDYKACDHCLKPLETLEDNAARLTGKSKKEFLYPSAYVIEPEVFTKCPECGIEYCSSDCLMKAFNLYHKSLCTKGDESHPLLTLNEIWKKMHYPPETNTIMIIPRILAIIHQKEGAKLIFSKMCHRSVNEDSELTHKFLGEKFTGDISTLYNTVKAAVGAEVAQEIPTLEDFQSLIALIGTNGQGVGSSPIAEWVRNVAKLPLSDAERQNVDTFIDDLYTEMNDNVGMFLNSEGVALYELQSVFNHSCVPHAEVNFFYNNSRLSVVATKDIVEGEEIYISYLDECSLERSRHSRNKELMENYLFVCDCLKCREQADEPDVTSEEEMNEECDGEEMSE